MYVRMYVCIYVCIYMYVSVYFTACSITTFITTCSLKTLLHMYSIYIFCGDVYTLCTYWSFTVFHILCSLQIRWTVLYICSLSHFSLLTICLLLRCTLLVFLFHCLILWRYTVHCLFSVDAGAFWGLYCLESM